MRARDTKGRFVEQNNGFCCECDKPAKSKGMCLKHYRAAWGKLNPDKRKRDPSYRQKVQKRYYYKNRDRLLRKQAVFYELNKERLLKRGEIWRKNNPESARRQSSLRRARLRSSSGSYSLSQLRSMYDAQKHKCIICKRGMLEKQYTVDHIVPLSRGGTNYIDNIQLLCSTCNKQKAAKDPVEFMRSRGMLI